MALEPWQREGGRSDGGHSLGRIEWQMGARTVSQEKGLRMGDGLVLSLAEGLGG